MAEAENAVVAPEPGSPEYEAAMVAKVDENAAKAVSDAAGAPVEAPKEVSEEAPADKAEGTEEKKPEGEAEKTPEGEKKEEATEAEKAVEAAGLDYNALQAEWEAGGLSEDSYKALEKVGFGKDIVDQHIAGLEALAELTIMHAAEAAGGREQLEAMQGWAKNVLSPAEIDSYNKAVSGSREDMTQAITALRSRYEAEYGRQPGLIGGRNAVAAVPGYSSRSEMTADMRNPQYSKDPAFRAKVASKIAATTAF